MASSPVGLEISLLLLTCRKLRYSCVEDFIRLGRRQQGQQFFFRLAARIFFVRQAADSSQPFALHEVFPKYVRWRTSAPAFFNTAPYKNFPGRSLGFLFLRMTCGRERERGRVPPETQVVVQIRAAIYVKGSYC